MISLQRGEGYFKNTYNGINLALEHGFSPGFICTFTPKSVDHYKEVFNFFAKNGIDFSIHASEPTLNEKMVN